jgi:hypothetical protein
MLEYTSLQPNVRLLLSRTRLNTYIKFAFHAIFGFMAKHDWGIMDGGRFDLDSTGALGVAAA